MLQADTESRRYAAVQLPIADGAAKRQIESYCIIFFQKKKKIRLPFSKLLSLLRHRSAYNTMFSTFHPTEYSDFDLERECGRIESVRKQLEKSTGTTFEALVEKHRFKSVRRITTSSLIEVIFAANAQLRNTFTEHFILTDIKDAIVSFEVFAPTMITLAASCSCPERNCLGKISIRCSRSQILAASEILSAGPKKTLFNRCSKTPDSNKTNMDTATAITLWVRDPSLAVKCSSVISKNVILFIQKSVVLILRNYNNGTIGFQ